MLSKHFYLCAINDKIYMWIVFWLIPYIFFLNCLYSLDTKWNLQHVNYPEKCEGWYFNGWLFKTICGEEIVVYLSLWSMLFHVVYLDW